MVQSKAYSKFLELLFRNNFKHLQEGCKNGELLTFYLVYFITLSKHTHRLLFLKLLRLSSRCGPVSLSVDSVLLTATAQNPDRESHRVQQCFRIQPSFRYHQLSSEFYFLAHPCTQDHSSHSLPCVSPLCLPCSCHCGGRWTSHFCIHSRFGFVHGLSTTQRRLWSEAASSPVLPGVRRFRRSCFWGCHVVWGVPARPLHGEVGLPLLISFL